MLMFQVQKEIADFRGRNEKKPGPSHAYVTGTICAKNVGTRIVQRSFLGHLSSFVEICVLHICLILWHNFLCDIFHNVVVPFSGSTKTKVSELPTGHPLKRFLDAIGSAGMNKLRKKIEKSWNTAENTPKIVYKFRGEEVRTIP